MPNYLGSEGILLHPGPIVLPEGINRFVADLPADALTPTRLIALAEPYLTFSDDSTVSSDDKLRGSLLPNFAMIVERSVAIYNELPAEWRQRRELPSRGERSERGRACTRAATVAYYWWGERIFLNDCMVNDLEGMLAAQVGGATLFAVLVSGGLAPIAAGVAAGILGLYIAALVWANQTCGGQGAYINALWFPPGVYWVSTIC